MKNANNVERLRKINMVIAAAWEKIKEEALSPNDAWMVADGLAFNLIINTDIYCRDSVIETLDQHKKMILDALEEEGLFPSIN